MKSKIIEFVLAWHFIFADLPQFIFRGGISIDTSFQYKPAFSNKSRKFLFRTTLQPDADIINFLPHPDLFLNDANWCKLYKEKYQEHREKFQPFLIRLKNSTKFMSLMIISGSWMISASLSSAPVTYLAEKHIIFITLWPILIYISRRMPVNYLLRLSIPILIKIINRTYARIDKGQRM